MRRHLFDHDHDDFRTSVRKFVDTEVVPDASSWDDAGVVPRELFTNAGAKGFLGTAVPETYGGGGIPDFRFNVVLNEELHRAGANSAALALTLHNDICMPYFRSYCTPEQGARWFPGIASGELIAAIAMTEPGAGSDLASISTTATRDRTGHYVVNGAKTFITNGINADLVIVAAKTNPEAGAQGISLLVLERGMDGLERGRNLAKLGLHGQDTAELSFTDVRVPPGNVLGSVGAGFAYLMAKLPQERLSIAVGAVAAARAAFDWTRDYVRQRSAFGRPIGSFQNTKFRMAEMATEIDVAQHYLDAAVLALNDESLTAADAAMAKWWCTELQGRAIDTCLQLHGGYGYMSEYPISRAYVDARVTRIYGGTTEIMKEIVGRSLGL